MSHVLKNAILKINGAKIKLVEWGTTKTNKQKLLTTIT